MATKKAASSSKKATTTKKSTTTTKPSTTSTTTVKAVTSPTGATVFTERVNVSPVLTALISEFIGTFLLAAAYIDLQGSPLYVAFVVVGIVLILGGLSKTHLNPAITIGALVTRRMGWKRAVGYIVAQVLGAGAAYAVLSAFLKSQTTTTTATSALYHAAPLVDGKNWYIFFAELIGTIVISFSVATAIHTNANKLTKAFTFGFGTLIGLALAVSATSPLLTVASTGFTVLNPAVALSLGALSWKVWPIAIYILAPFIGGVIGYMLQSVLRVQSDVVTED